MVVLSRATVNLSLSSWTASSSVESVLEEVGRVGGVAVGRWTSS